MISLLSKLINLILFNYIVFNKEFIILLNNSYYTIEDIGVCFSLGGNQF